MSSGKLTDNEKGLRGIKDGSLTGMHPGTLHVQEPLFLVDASRIACQLAASAHNTVAGDNERQGIMTHSSSDGLG